MKQEEVWQKETPEGQTKQPLSVKNAKYIV
jgi:hypothetical protein